MKTAPATPPVPPESELVDAATERLIAHMAHELRTPLSSALLWARILNTPDAPPDAERLREGLDAIEESIREQQAVIDGLVDIAEIISGRAQLDLHEIDPQPALQRAIEAARPTAEEAGIQLEFAVGAGVGAVRADDRRLQQAVAQLLENALKFTPRKGRIALTLERRGAEVEIRVTDNGQGIAPDYLPRVFDRFASVSPAVGRAQRGYGLGLLLTRNLVTRMDGSVRAQSAGLGQGSSFVIRLPAVG
ncbi:MAG: HAMP domain-containing histidine kinase [Verrucomicrobia bacterium]|nr:HAMP domain-containing histidine kinase [Verrucomicrobiota bacterium]